MCKIKRRKRRKLELLVAKKERETCIRTKHKSLKMLIIKLKILTDTSGIRATARKCAQICTN